MQQFNPENPWKSRIRLEDSAYYRIIDDKLTNVLTGKPATVVIDYLHTSLKAMCTHPGYECIGARPVFSNKDERLMVYQRMSDCDINVVCHDLYEYIKEYKAEESGNDITGLLFFVEQETTDPLEFRKLLWNFLHRLSVAQSEFFHWAEGYSPITDDKLFSLSFAGVAIFVAGFFGSSPRVARRFAFPGLIVNPHEQFDRLKVAGLYDKWKKVIRERGEKLNGTANPASTDHGTESEWPQYDSINIPSACPYRNLILKSQTVAQTVRCPYTRVKAFLTKLFGFLSSSCHPHHLKKAMS